MEDISHGLYVFRSEILYLLISSKMDSQTISIPQLLPFKIISQDKLIKKKKSHQ